MLRSSQEWLNAPQLNWPKQLPVTPMESSSEEKEVSFHIAAKPKTSILTTDQYSNITRLMSQQRSFLVHTVKLKPIIKAQISGKFVTSGISDVAIA